MDISRKMAAEILTEYKPLKTNLSVLIDKAFSSAAGKSPDIKKGFVRLLVRACVSRLNTIDFFINRLVKSPDSVKTGLRNTLRLGVCQIYYMGSEIPEYAAVNEAVLAGKNEREKGFINAILRGFQRGKDELEKEIRSFETVRRLSLEHSYPEWMVSRWIKRFGVPEAESLCRAGNEQAKLAVRVNTLKTSRDALGKIFEEEGVKYEFAQFSDVCLNILDACELEKLKSYQDGLFTVQDEASQLVSCILAPLPGDTIADLCCGSGTKSTHLAQMGANKSKIQAFDLSADRIKQARALSERLGAENIEFKDEDALKLKKLSADKVLLDAPCSGLGVIRRKPDIKWNRVKEDVTDRMPALQVRLLKAASNLLSPGGTLVYSVCSTEMEEGEDVIKEFTARNKEFSAERIELGNEAFTGRYFRVLPHKYPMDGFFAAKLIRIK